MKKHILIIFLLASGILFFPGCKKFLEEKGSPNLDQTTFPKSESDLRILCNGMYNNMNINEFYGRSYLIMSDTYSDEITTTQAVGPRYDIENFVITASNTEVSNWWTRSYLIIGRANQVVNVTPFVPVSEAIRNRFIAEAKFIRAFTYFQMVRLFGDVPLILQQPAGIDSLKNFKPSRTPQSEVYKKIIEDLLFAEANLPKEKTISLKGIPSTGAASSLLAKVYLTRGYLSFAETDDFNKAAAKCLQVINSGDYDLFPNFSDVFDYTKKNGIEHIFSIQFELSPLGPNAIVSFLSPPAVYPRAFGIFPAERKFYNAFPGTDVIRKANSFYSVGVGFTGTPYDFISNPNSNVYCAKFKDANTLVSNNDRTNYIFLRFADVLLMHSEALNQVNPADPAKYTGINRVRARVSLPDLSGLPSKEAFQDALFNERQWELCFEGQRRYDLIRMGKLVPVMTALGKTNIRDFHKFYPVPQTEIDLNSNLLPQNTGY